MNFTADERRVLALLADLLIPAGDGFPSASQAFVAESGLDQLLSVRADLGPALKAVLHKAIGQDPNEFISFLRSNAPGEFGVLTEVVSGAYFLNAQVRERLGYSGQTARPIDPVPDYLEEGLLQSVIQRGRIYR